MILTISLLGKAILFFLAIACGLGIWYYFAIARPTDRQVKKSHEKNKPTEKDIRDWDDVLKKQNGF